VESDISFLTAEASLLKLSFEEHLSRVVSYEMRPFMRNQFRDFMVAQSKPWPKMLDLAAQLKAQHGMTIDIISNDSREVNAYRMRTLKLDRLVDTLIYSCFVQKRKPDAGIFRLGHDLTQTAPAQAVFIDSTFMFVHCRVPGDARHSSSRLRVRPD
jgi:putative hydrolase of the HAD superfamily